MASPLFTRVLARCVRLGGIASISAERLQPRQLLASGARRPQSTQRPDLILIKGRRPATDLLSGLFTWPNGARKSSSRQIKRLLEIKCAFRAAHFGHINHRTSRRLPTNDPGPASGSRGESGSLAGRKAAVLARGYIWIGGEIYIATACRARPSASRAQNTAKVARGSGVWRAGQVK